MRFEPGRPVRLNVPSVVVDAGLEPGEHRFRLVVVNQRGTQSQPVEVTVTVVRLVPRPPLPTPIPRPTPLPLPSPPSRPETDPIR
jgi:hypothetical protein